MEDIYVRENASK